jgi:hypothetical protein
VLPIYIFNSEIYWILILQFRHDTPFQVRNYARLRVYIQQTLTLECEALNQTRKTSNWKFCSWKRTTKAKQTVYCKYAYKKRIDDHLWTYKKEKCDDFFDRARLIPSSDSDNGLFNTRCKLEIDNVSYEEEGDWDCVLTLCNKPIAQGCENPNGSKNSKKATIAVDVRMIYYRSKPILA